MENITKEKGIEWYRFGQKKGSLLAREIPIKEVFANKISQKIKGFSFVFNNYKYVNWTHFIDKRDVDLIVKNFSRKLNEPKDLNILLKQSNDTVKAESREAKGMQLAESDDKKLLKYFEKFIFYNAKIESFLVSSNFVVRTLSWQVEEKLKQIFSEKNNQELKQLAMDLSFSEQKSVFLKRQIDLLNLAKSKKISEKKLVIL